MCRIFGSHFGQKISQSPPSSGSEVDKELFLSLQVFTQTVGTVSGEPSYLTQKTESQILRERARI